MLNNVSARTRSGLNRYWWAFVVLLIGAVLYLFVGRMATGYRPLSHNGQTVHLEIAASDDQRARGLGGRPALASDRGMLFVYNRPAVRCFWMKDMRFPIDIIWLDSSQKVVHIVPALRPETYPQTFCGADRLSQYVVELPAGRAASLGVEQGQTLRF